jgi:hypothetical protein
MNKLESLSKDKFKDFTEFELVDAIKIIGGEPVATTIRCEPDYYDYKTNDTRSTDGAGVPRDFYRKPMPSLDHSIQP